MSRSLKRTGFTLIELLIVIAIILILIAIALPNFLEAQVRARVVRSAADERSLGQAVESFRIDRGFLLIDMWDDEELEGRLALRQTFLRDIGNFDPSSRMMTDVLAPLTTPVAYIKAIPRDPFLYDPPVGPTPVSGWINRTNTYTYFDRDPKIPENRWVDDHNLRRFWPNYHNLPHKRLRDGEFGFMGVGPDFKVNQEQSPLIPRGISYSPTNGTNSNGQIIWLSGKGAVDL